MRLFQTPPEVKIIIDTYIYMRVENTTYLSNEGLHWYVLKTGKKMSKEKSLELKKTYERERLCPSSENT